MSGDINRPPSGCTYCGIGAAYHARQYVPGPGWHSYEPPTESQIRIRMLNRRREIAELRDAMGADALQNGQSATLRAEDASGGAFQANTSSILPQGLSEPELFADACDCECRPGQPCLCPERDCYCGPCRVCGDNLQQPNDTTEDDRG